MNKIKSRVALTLISTGAYLFWALSEAHVADLKNVQYQRIAEEKADTNHNGRIEPDEALQVYRNMKFSAERIISLIPFKTYEIYLNKNWGTDVVNVLDEVINKEKEGHNLIRYNIFHALIKQKYGEKPSLEQSEEIYRICHECSEARLSLRFFGKPIYYLPFAPQSVIRGSELERYALEDRK